MPGYLALERGERASYVFQDGKSAEAIQIINSSKTWDNTVWTVEIYQGNKQCGPNWS